MRLQLAVEAGAGRFGAQQGLHQAAEVGQDGAQQAAHGARPGTAADRQARVVEHDVQRLLDPLLDDAQKGIDHTPAYPVAEQGADVDPQALRGLIDRPLGLGRGQVAECGARAGKDSPHRVPAQGCDGVEQALRGGEGKEHLQRLGPRARGHGKERRDGPRLQQVDLAPGPGPLEILRPVEEPGQLPAQPGQLGDGPVGQGLARGGLLGPGKGPPTLPGTDREGLGAQGPFQDAAAGGVDAVTVGLHLAGDEGLAQAQRRLGDHLGALAVEGVGGKEDARDLGRHHLLHDDGQGQVVVGDAVPQAVADGPGGPQAAPAAHDRLQQVFYADDVEQGVLLAGKGQLGQVLGGGRGADGDGRRSQLGIGPAQGCLQAGRQLTGRKALADGVRGGLQGGGVLVRQAGQGGLDGAGQVVVGHVGTIGRGGQDKAGRDGVPARGQAGQVGALAAGDLEGGGGAVQGQDDGLVCTVRF